MNKEQIKTELRRAACDYYSVFECEIFAFREALKWRLNGEVVGDLSKDDARTFFLLVAEAM